MGWTFIHNSSKTDVKRACLQSWTAGDMQCRPIAHKMVGNCLWSVWEKRQGNFIDQYIVVDLLAKSQGDWGNKSMSESEHPYHYDCPLEFLDMAPVACQEWRDAVKRWHKERYRIKNITIGDVVKLSNGQQASITSKQKRTWVGVIDGKTYRIPTRMIESVV